MGVELVQIGVQIRKVLIFSTRTCYRSVVKHPFIVGLVVFLIFLYRSFPFLFSLLVYASPVIVCTAVLLGTLLSFGDPNIPEIEKEIEKEERSVHEIAALRTSVRRAATIVARDLSSDSEGFTDSTSHFVENSLQGKSSVVSDSFAVDKCDGLVDKAFLIGEKSLRFQVEEHVIEEATKEVGDRGLEQENDLNGGKICGEEVLENHYSQVQQSEDENAEMENEKLPDSSINSRIDQLNSDSPWKRVEEDNEDDDDDEASDLGSDLAESSSPDASMADIMPLLDELHPLLDEETSQPVHMSHDGSDAASEHSIESSESSNESEDDTTNQEALEAGEGEEEEETQSNKEDETKSAITWTEDDQKNLMNLGSSELERNQRLENLIARRRARKNMRMMAERNLIDLEGDLTFNVAPISTARHNPFDLPFDSNDNVPGSAPSVLLPRRNPFDLPYDSSEEKPDLVANTFRPEFGASRPKEPFFRRHESFNVGPSFFGPSRQERQEFKFRPYFVPEQMASEGTSYPSFQRQLSGISDSKASSVPDSESIASVGEQENDNHIEDDLSQEPESVSIAGHISERVGHDSSVPDTESMDSGGDVENVKHNEVDLSQVAEFISHTPDHVGHGSSVPDSESTASGEDIESEKHIEDVLSQDAELISITGHASLHVGHGSPSSEDAEILELGHVQESDEGLDVRNIEYGDMDDHQEVESNIAETDSPATPMEGNLNEFHLTPDNEQKLVSRSSLSSVSELNEEIFDEKRGEELSTAVLASDSSFIDSSHSMRTSVLNSHGITSLVVENSHQNEPIYDSSPHSLQKNLSSSSISTDLHADMSEVVQSPVNVSRSISFAERDSEVSTRTVEEDVYHHMELVDSSERDAVDDTELGSRSLIEVSEADLEGFGLSEVNDNSAGANASTVLDLAVKHNPTDLQPQEATEMVEDLLPQDDKFQHAPDQLQSSSINADLFVVVNHDVGAAYSADSSPEINHAEDQHLAESEEPSLAVEQSLTLLPDTSPPETESVEYLMDKEVPHEFEEGHGISLSSDVKVYEAIQEEAEEQLAPTHHKNVHDDEITSHPEKEFEFSDGYIDKTFPDNPEEMQVQLNEETGPSNSLDISKAEDLDAEGSPNRYSAFAPEPSVTRSEGIESETPVIVGHLSNECNFQAETFDSDIDAPIEGANEDEINEIEESFLAELDTVGDFSIMSMNDTEKQHVTVQDSIPLQHEFETSTREAENCAIGLVHQSEVIAVAESIATSKTEEEICPSEAVGPSEVQISRTSSTGYADEVISSANEVIPPKNVEATVSEADVEIAIEVISPENVEPTVNMTDVQITKEVMSSEKGEPTVNETDVQITKEVMLPENGKSTVNEASEGATTAVAANVEHEVETSEGSTLSTSGAKGKNDKSQKSRSSSSSSSSSSSESSDSNKE